MQSGQPWPLSQLSYWRSSRPANSAHLSTSSSEPVALLYVKILLGTCASLVIALELFSSYIAQHHSVTVTRVSKQHMEATKIRPAPPGGPISVLMVGNSLLLDGVDVLRLRELTSRNLRIYPIFLEGTGYYDWVYGLRHLFRLGARPQVVVIGLDGHSALADSVSDQSPMLLFGPLDILDVASELRLDHTEASNLLLSHVSTFWGMRSFFRRRILSGLVPHYQDLFPFIRPGDLTIPMGPELETRITSRLRTLRELCKAHGAKLILLIPPTPSSENVVRRMAVAAGNAGVETLVPIDPSAFPDRFYYPDRFHLNPDGAVRFTSALAVELPKTIAAVFTPQPRDAESRQHVTNFE
jgi:hypothetical protein